MPQVLSLGHYRLILGNCRLILSLKFPLHQRASAPGFSYTLESLAAIHCNQSLRCNAVVRRSRFKARGTEALSTRVGDGGIDQFGRDSAPAMLLIHFEIRNVCLTRAG